MNDNTVTSAILGIVEYAVCKELLPLSDKTWAISGIMDVLQLESRDCSSPCLESRWRSFLTFY